MSEEEIKILELRIKTLEEIIIDLAVRLDGKFSTEENPYKYICRYDIKSQIENAREGKE